MGSKASENEIFLQRIGSSEKLEERNDEEIGRKDHRSWKSSKSCSSKASQMSDPFYSPISERTERSKVEMSSHRRISSFSSHKVLQTDHFMEADEKQAPANSQARHLLKDVCHSLTTSKQLLKVLSRVWSIEEQKSTCVSLFATLRSELDRACAQVTKLIQERRHNYTEIDALLKRFDEERVVWRMKEECRIQGVIGELKTEKKLRKQAERLNKKLGRELLDTKASLTMAVKEAESQKRAMEVLERVCEELAKGVGEDKAKSEDLRRAREDVEKEREMLQLADVFREERVQMKLSEAKFQFEEKTAVLDKLKTDLEARLAPENQSPDHDRLKALKKHFRETLPRLPEESDSADSELHCIELNMDETNKSYEWSSAKASQERQGSDAIEWEFGNGGLFESGSEAWRNEYEDEIERYNMIKDLRDHFVSSSKIAPSQDFVSPT